MSGIGGFGVAWSVWEEKSDMGEEEVEEEEEADDDNAGEDDDMLGCRGDDGSVILHTTLLTGQ